MKSNNLRIGDSAPDFIAPSTQGELSFYEWAGSNWVIFFSHPADFTPVCTTELGEFARREAEFKRRNVKLLGISINELKDHHTWIRDINEIHSCNLSYPIIADNDFKVAQAYGMIDQATESKELPYTVRSLFFIDPSKKVRAIISYPASTGRNVNEVIRVLDSLQLCDKQKVATPANWTPGKEVRYDVSNEEASKLFPDYRAVKPYLRFTNVQN